MNLGILGLGEVGSAVKKLVSKKHKVFVRELAYDEIGDRAIDTLHVCIPYTKSFDNTVKKTITELKPSLTIINSTVKPGTTQKLFGQTRLPIAHAPIMGVHPNLYKYFFTFDKPLGGANQQSYLLAKRHFNHLGVKTVKFDSPLETELAKTLSTTYYGWIIIFEKWLHSLCQRQGANFSQVYTKFNHIYNQGYAGNRDRPHVTRSIIKHSQGPIGGHCVIPNTQILNELFKDDFTTFLLAQNGKLGKKGSKRIE